MSDKYGIDSHKLMYHPKRVSEWLDGKNIYPIYAEISLSGSCNHRCEFCAFDYMGYKPNFLAAQLLKSALSEMAQLGLKSVMYGGEGEPLLHKDINDIFDFTTNFMLDMALTTNGVFLDKVGDLDNFTWIKISLNAGTRETYKKIHQRDDFDKVIGNIKKIVKQKEDSGYKTTIGIQCLLLPDNETEIKLLAEKSKELGVDYLVIKPYSQHLFSETKQYKDVDYSSCIETFENEVFEYNDDKFQTIIRLDTMERWDNKTRNYKECLALPFWTYIDAGGNVCGCSCYLGDDKFHYGNIYKESFVEIWKGNKRTESLDWVKNQLDVSKCRINCRMDKGNEYLWELKHPQDHINFI